GRVIAGENFYGDVQGKLGGGAGGPSASPVVQRDNIYARRAIDAKGGHQNQSYDLNDAVLLPVDGDDDAKRKATDYYFKLDTLSKGQLTAPAQQPANGPELQAGKPFAQADAPKDQKPPVTLRVESAGVPGAAG